MRSDVIMGSVVIHQAYQKIHDFKNFQRMDSEMLENTQKLMIFVATVRHNYFYLWIMHIQFLYLHSRYSGIGRFCVDPFNIYRRHPGSAKVYQTHYP
jgi:hypothetical protein